MRRAYRIGCATVFTGQPAQSLREIVGKTEGFSGLSNGLPDAGCELQGGDILGEVVYSMRQRPGTAQRHERGHAQAGGDANPSLLSQLDMDAVFHLVQVDCDCCSAAGGIPARGGDLDEALLATADFLRFEVALVEFGDERIGEIRGADRSMEGFLTHGFILHKLIHSHRLSCV